VTLTPCKHPHCYAETCRACALEKEGKVLVELPEEFRGFIVRAATGAVYTNQTGGTMCAHPEMEGYVDWPPEHSILERDITVWVEKHGGSSMNMSPVLKKSMRDAWFSGPEAKYGHASQADVDKLVKLKLPLELDREALLTECWGEAWIPVILEDGRRAIFTYHNSD
jgi:hypothetical protein